MLPSEGKLLRVFIGESDRHDGLPLYEWIVAEARARHLAGATVVRGMQGFGAHSRVHTAKILRLSQDLPIVIEIVDEAAKVAEFMAVIDPVIQEGLATLEDVEIRLYRTRPPSPPEQTPPPHSGSTPP